MISKVFHEPLLHFVVAASLVFVYFAWIAPPNNSEDTIVIDSGLLSANWQRTWRRPPTAEELEGLVQEAIFNELTIKEALRLGLDEGDAVVRNRMVQKMQFLRDQQMPNPSEADLEQWFDDHKQRYAGELRISFKQEYLGQELREGSATPATPLIGVPSQFQGVEISSVARQFGEGFAAQLKDAEVGQWIEAVNSGFGFHRVFVSAMQSPQQASLVSPDVRRRVENDFRDNQRKQWLSAELDRLKQHYQIEIID